MRHYIQGESVQALAVAKADSARSHRYDSRLRSFDNRGKLLQGMVAACTPGTDEHANAMRMMMEHLNTSPPEITPEAQRTHPRTQEAPPAAEAAAAAPGAAAPGAGAAAPGDDN